MAGMTFSPEEVARFDALAARWWDLSGPMLPLHRMNPARVMWITDRIKPGSKPTADRETAPPLAGGGGGEGVRKVLAAPPPPNPLPQGERRSLSAPASSPSPTRILDIGCGAGLAAEALARRGFDVLGLDAASEAIEVARAHAAGQQLLVAYRVGVAEDLVAEGARFPVITALEVIEHVPDPAAFLAALVTLLEPGGQLFLSTLNRTRRSFLAAKVGAEYLLRWLPVGTHDWRRFITPVELAALLRDAGMRVADIVGLAPDPLTGRWHAVRDTAVNYIIAASA